MEDARRLDPAIDARDVEVRPRRQQHAGRDRHEAGARRELVAMVARPPAERVRHQLRSFVEPGQRVDELGDDVTDTRSDPDERGDVERDGRVRAHSDRITLMRLRPPALDHGKASATTPDLRPAPGCS